MIDWIETEREFGYSEIPNNKRPKVICRCDTCQKPRTIAIRIKSTIINGQMPWLCPSCVKKLESDQISIRMKKQWEDNKYRQRRTAGTAALLKSETFREKQKLATKKSMKNVDVSSILKERYKDPAAREKIRKASTKAWQNKELRALHLLIMRSSAIRVLCSDGTKAAWKTEEYKEKMRLSHLSLRQHMSECGKQLWKSVEYREKIAAYWNDPEFLKKHAKAVSAISKELWKNETYRNRVSSAVRAALATPEAKARLSQNSKLVWERHDYRKKLAIARAAQLGRTSSIQKMLYEFLDNFDIPYFKEGEQTRIGYFVFDCLIPNIGHKNLLIECQGDYWHSLSNAERNDKAKFTYIERYFPEYEIMYVWEHEFYCKDRVLDRLKLKLGLNIETKEFNFSDLIIEEANADEVKGFLDRYHYIGKGRGGRAIGAYLDGALIAVVIFSPPLRQNTAGQFGLQDGEVRELSRLCIHPSYHKDNFATWLISRTLRFIDCKLIIAYADTTVGHTGTIYKASNFELHHTVPADYWYIDPKGYVMHKRTLYGRARSLQMTEYEFAEKYGYIKKYGGEKLCFIKRIN